jgi:hypothetical protein
VPVKKIAFFPERSLFITHVREPRNLFFVLTSFSYGKTVSLSSKTAGPLLFESFKAIGSISRDCKNENRQETNRGIR